ncbi:ABC transporter substrate-binding protein [Rhodococcus sp. NPDC059968]|uniref:ABC transporter substrate-binding protein n=1 Tax=Rhodococcus sp. NPDC059968 TaxID=3347017 RepID=UPI003670C02E
MIFSRFRFAGAAVCGLAVIALTLSACGSASTGTSTGAQTATSASDFGDMDALIAAAQKEGSVNTLALSRDWANYGAIIDSFTAKYGITVNLENPHGSSQDVLNAITSRKGQERAPDVAEVGAAFALSGQQQGLFAPYKVASFNKIPADQAAADGTWYNDYNGYVSIGCDAKKVTTCPKTFADLRNPRYKGMIALSGDPSQAGGAFAAVYAAALANGGSLDNIQPGIDFFAELHKIGNFNPVQATQATIGSGETPIAIYWDFLNTGYADEFNSKGLDWQVNIPTDGKYANYYTQAINKWAPHPAAARLWQEYLYSVEGQNLFLAGYARPVLTSSMQQDGTLDQAAAAKLPPVSGTAAFPTQDQLNNAKQVLGQGWAKAISG